MTVKHCEGQSSGVASRSGDLGLSLSFYASGKNCNFHEHDPVASVVFPFLLSSSPISHHILYHGDDPVREALLICGARDYRDCCGRLRQEDSGSCHVAREQVGRYSVERMRLVSANRSPCESGVLVALDFTSGL